MKVSILSRISTSQQSNESGLEELRKICRNNDYEIVEEYIEVVSGSKGKGDRTELQRMLSDCKKGLFQKVIVLELSRLGRSLSHLVSTLQEMKESDVDLYSVKEGIDTSTSSGKVLFGMIGVFSEFELDTRKHRVQRGIDHYRKTNESWGRPKSYTVEFKNNVVELKDSGLSLRKISSQLDCSTSLVQRVLRSVS